MGLALGYDCSLPQRGWESQKNTFYPYAPKHIHTTLIGHTRKTVMFGGVTRIVCHVTVVSLDVTVGVWRIGWTVTDVLADDSEHTVRGTHLFFVMCMQKVSSFLRTPPCPP